MIRPWSPHCWSNWCKLRSWLVAGHRSPDQGGLTVLHKNSLLQLIPKSLLIRYRSMKVSSEVLKISESFSNSWAYHLVDVRSLMLRYSAWSCVEEITVATKIRNPLENETKRARGYIGRNSSKNSLIFFPFFFFFMRFGFPQVVKIPRESLETNDTPKVMSG